MKKIIILIIAILLLIPLVVIVFSKEVNEYELIVPKDEIYTQYNSFDIYDIKAYDKDNNNLIDNVEVYGLELLNLDGDRITEFGSFNLRYTIEIEEVIVIHEYRNIKVIYDRNSIGGFIYNSDFLAGINEWGVVDWKNSLDVCVENDSLKIVQNSVDDYIWDQSIYQYVSGLEINKRYKIVVDVKSTEAKTIQVCLAQPLDNDPYAYRVMNEYDLVINNEFTTYEIEFICTYPNNIVDLYEFDINKVRLEFRFGKNNEINNKNSVIYFDNINIFELN